MKFESGELPLGEGRENIYEEQYPFLVHDIIAYIDEIKKTEKNTSLVDIIIDFAFKKGIDVEAIGDAISGDVYFKSFIEKDCELHNIFKTDNVQLDDW